MTWMEKLADHYERERRRYPNDAFLIVFDIDGTILDMRHSMLHVLRAYDRQHGTCHFDDIDLMDLDDEGRVASLVARLGLGAEDRLRVLDWYRVERWSPEAILRSHTPFAGVMEVIRWFQIQSNTFVALNTGRPESVRLDTIRTLNTLGQEYKVRFNDGLLHMNPYGWHHRVREAKVEGVRRFLDAGYRVVACVDNQSENLRAVSEIDPEGEILLLHADTTFRSVRTGAGARIVSGRGYDLTELAREDRLPRHVHFVWHGLNDVANLRQFLGSNVRWGEVDVQWHPTGRYPILRHDRFDEIGRAHV